MRRYAGRMTTASAHVAERTGASDASSSADEERGCVPSGAQAMSAARADALARQFKALADPGRLRLVSLISSSARNEACVCDLTGPLGLGQPTVSHHLKVLVDAGILHREKRGVWAYFSIVPGALDSLARVLTENS